MLSGAGARSVSEGATVSVCFLRNDRGQRPETKPNREASLYAQGMDAEWLRQAKPGSVNDSPVGEADAYNPETSNFRHDEKFPIGEI